MCSVVVVEMYVGDFNFARRTTIVDDVVVVWYALRIGGDKDV
jgi:hypothetical protein